MMIREVIEPLRVQGKLDAVLVTDSAAELLDAVYAPETDAEAIQDLWQLAARTVSRAPNTKSLKQLREAIFYDWEGRQLVCRPFDVKKKYYLLVMLIPARKTYKQTASKLVKALKTVLKS